MFRKSFRGFKKIRIRILNKSKSRLRPTRKEDNKLGEKLFRRFKLDCLKLRLKKFAIICPINTRKSLKV